MGRAVKIPVILAVVVLLALVYAVPAFAGECVMQGPTPEFPWGGVDCSGSDAGDWNEPDMTVLPA